MILGTIRESIWPYRESSSFLKESSWEETRREADGYLSSSDLPSL